MSRATPAVAVLAGLAALFGCADADTDRAPGRSDTPRLDWAIAIHGGAGTIRRDRPEAERRSHEAGLTAALEAGRERLVAGDPAIDVVEHVIRILEDDEEFNAGRGAVFTWEGGHALDASIMDGSNAACGAVAGVTTVRHPITLARRVMDRTAHVLLAGEGAERFADREGVERVAPEWFDTERRREAWREFRERRSTEEPHGTVGVVALDRAGNLAAGTSTGGLTGKRWGRVGDSPIVGAGTWADNESCAVSATGTGEQFIRHAVARTIAARTQWAGEDCATAARVLIEDVLDPGDGGVIVLDRRGRTTAVFSSSGMYRGAADSTGRLEVAIW